MIAGRDFNQTFRISRGYPVVDAENWMPRVLSADMLPGAGSSRWMPLRPHAGCFPARIPGPGQTQLYVIDGFILSPNVALNSVHTLDLDFEYADHNRRMLDVELQ